MQEEQQAALDDVQETDSLDSQQAETLETTDEGAQAESAPAEGTEKDNVQKRIDKLTAEKYAEKRKREELQAKLDNLGTEPKPVEPQGKPTLEQFEYDQDAYSEALVSWNVQEQLAKREAQQQQAETERAANQREAAFDRQEIDYVTNNPDYVQDIGALPRFPPATLDVIKGQENAPALVHYLAKNPELAENIATLDTMSAAVQIGVITANNSAQGKQTKQPSAAPDPIEPITPKGSTMSDNDSPFIKGATFE